MDRRPGFEARPVESAERSQAGRIFAPREQHSGHFAHPLARSSHRRYLSPVFARTRLATIWLAVAIVFCSSPVGWGDDTAGRLQRGRHEQRLPQRADGGGVRPDGRKFVTEKSGRVRVVAANGAVVLDAAARHPRQGQQLQRPRHARHRDRQGLRHQRLPLPALRLRAEPDGPGHRRADGLASDPGHRQGRQHAREPREPGDDDPRQGRERALPDARQPARLHPRGLQVAHDRHRALGPGRRHAVARQRGHAPLQRQLHLLPPPRRGSRSRARSSTSTGRGVGCRGIPSAPPTPTSTTSARRSTRRASGTRSASRCARARGPVVGRRRRRRPRRSSTSIQPGKSYGWPCYEGTIVRRSTRPSPAASRSTPRRARRPPQTPPSWSYAHGGGASITGGVVYSGTRYPADYRGDIFVGDYVQGWVKRLDVDSSDRVTAVARLRPDWPTGVDIQADSRQRRHRLRGHRLRRASRRE